MPVGINALSEDIIVESGNPDDFGPDLEVVYFTMIMIVQIWSGLLYADSENKIRIVLCWH